MQKIPIFFSDADYDTIKSMAACNYLPSQIALQLGINKQSFLEEYNNTSSLVRQSYDAGVLATTFAIMNKQKDLAEGGNITATQIFLKEKDLNFNAIIRDRLLYGDDVN